MTDDTRDNLVGKALSFSQRYGRDAPHPSQDALDALYYMYFMVQTEGEDFSPMQWVEEYRPQLFQFLTQLFHQVTSEEQMDSWGHVAYWAFAIPKAVEELS